MILESVLLLSFDLKSNIQKDIKNEISTISLNERFYDAEEKVILDQETIELFQKLFQEVDRTNFDFR